MKSLAKWMFTCVLTLVTSLGAVGTAPAQEKVQIKFKVFDTNNPDSTDPLPLRPLALLSVRDKVTKLPAFPQDIPVARLGDGFFQVEVDKNVLVEHLMIEIDNPRYSPADIAKVITKAPITVYPGASNSEDAFSISAYGAQMNAYRAILTDLVTALPGRRRDIQTLLGTKFRSQLENMARAPGIPDRLLTNDPQEIATARRLADEVLKLYGLRPESAPSLDNQPGVALEGCCPCCPEAMYITPPPKRGLFRNRWR
jgi:hypothetical protein